MFDKCLFTVQETKVKEKPSDYDDDYYYYYDDDSSPLDSRWVKFWVNSERRKNNLPRSCYYSNEVLHIHGKINSSPIMMGVNDYSQISNQRLLKANRRCERALIKPLSSPSYYPERKLELIDIIDESSIICIYGMSLGRTDDNWWREIALWLLRGRKNHLIIFAWDPNCNFNLAGCYDDTEEYFQELIINKLHTIFRGISRLKDQIHVCINIDLFNGIKIRKIISNRKEAAVKEI
ncbi:hypothetical protein SDC9_115408 [bioreactor metagenome]|uniref:Uncharacterized protein n=1 Tax=bioreactor metagenome TaxID=1076179 RepID=A0A645BT25_9ZZZZ